MEKLIENTLQWENFDNGSGIANYSEENTINYVKLKEKETEE